MKILDKLFNRKKKFVVTFENLTEPQILALKDLFYTWQYLGNLGGSRWTAFYSDGDGNFRPKISTNKGPVESYKLHIDSEANAFAGRWENNVTLHDIYMIDFDTIAWDLYAIQEKKRKERNEIISSNMFTK